MYAVVNMSFRVMDRLSARRVSRCPIGVLNGKCETSCDGETDIFSATDGKKLKPGGYQEKAFVSYL